MVESPNAKEASEDAEKYGTPDGIGGAVTEEPRVGDCVVDDYHQYCEAASIEPPDVTDDEAVDEWGTVSSMTTASTASIEPDVTDDEADDELGAGNPPAGNQPAPKRRVRNAAYLRRQKRRLAKFGPAWESTWSLD